jgi:pimeloyl-ACP methyl ester carboxylesterase
MVAVLENRNRIFVNLFEQKGKLAPLVFVLSGTGGTAFSSSALATGKQLFDLGYHVVTLPNNVNYQYALGVSRTGAPGYLPSDVKEYYELLAQVTTYLKTKKALLIQDYSILGYSLGGLMAGFLVQEDANGAKLFNFKKIVMIDPAVDIGYAIDVLDTAYDAGSRISSGRKAFINRMIFSIGSYAFDHGFDLNKVLASVDKINLTLDERQWLVGYNFRNDLGDLVFASQQINDIKVLKK